MRINDHFLKLKAGYLFPEIARRVKAHQEANSEADIIRLGIGDVTRALPEAVRTSMIEAVNDLGSDASFVGYGPEAGHAFLREAIVRGIMPGLISMLRKSLFLMAASAIAATSWIFSAPATALRCPIRCTRCTWTPNVMAGNTGEAGEDGEFAGLTYLRMNPENGFQPELPSEPVDVIYCAIPTIRQARWPVRHTCNSGSILPASTAR